MNEHICARFGGLLRKTVTAATLFTLITTFFVFLPGQTTAATVNKKLIRPQAANMFVSNTFVISQFQVAGGNAADEFVELHNVSGNDVDLNGYRLVYRSAAGTSDVTIASWAVSTVIPAGGYYLIAHAAGYDGTTNANVTFNAGSTGSFSASSGGFALRNGAANTGTIIDSVGYGSATNAFVETTTTAVPVANDSKARSGEGCTDTDNNSVDFVTVSPSAPRNSQSAVVICDGTGGRPTLSINNVTLTEGNSGTKTFSFTVSLSAPAGENGVTFDIATADGTATTTDNDYVSNSLTGQMIPAGLQTYTFNVTVNGDTAVEPTETFSVNVTNVSGAPVVDGTGTGTITTDDVSTAPTATGTANPSTVQAGGTVLLTVNVTPGTNPTSTGIAVTGNLTSIAGSAAQTFYDDGTNGDQTAGDNVFTYQATVGAGTASGAKTLPITITDAQSRTRNINIGLTVGTTGAHSPEEHLIMGNPSNATTDINNSLNYLMLKEQYALSYNRDRAIPNWVSWHLDSSWLGSAPRQNDFRPDPTLPTDWYHVSGSSYSGSGFDRGHYTPSADRTSSIPDNSATFLMTNMMPQAPGNNQGPWEKLESYSRTLVGEGNELYIIGGGIGTGGTGDNGFANTIDAGRITVPAQTWKVIIILPAGDNDSSRVTSSTRTIGVIMPNNTAIRPDQWQKYITTVDQVEALTGYDFFSNVEPSIQAQIESKLDAANNTAPSAGGQSKTTAEDTAVNVTLSASDPNVNNQLEYNIISYPTNGILSGTGANLTYTPNANFFGTDSFTYQASDGTFSSGTAAINFTVTEINDAPVAAPDFKGTARNTVLMFAAADLLSNDSKGAANENAQTLTVSQVAVNAQTHGTVSLSGGQITYTPDANYTGAAAFSYQVCDNGTSNGIADGKCGTGTVNISVGEQAYSISGTVTYGIREENETPRGLSNVNLNATGASTVSAISNSAGDYQLSGLTGGKYTVKPAKTGEVNGINSLDSTRIQQHLVGLRTLSASQIIAADTDGNGIVNSLDATRIQQYLVGIPAANIIGQWKFLPADRQYESVNGEITGQNFQGVLVGEVSGNWSSSQFAENLETSEESIISSTDYQPDAAAIFERGVDDMVTKKMRLSGQFQSSEQAGEIPAASNSRKANSDKNALAVSIPANIMASAGGTVSVPISIGALPEEMSIESFDLSLFFDPSVLQPALTANDGNSPTLSSGCSVLSNSSASNKITVSGACLTPITNGSDVLYRLNFNVIGAPHQQTILTFTDPATAVETFKFNDGSTIVNTTDEMFAVSGSPEASVTIAGKATTEQGRGIGNVSIVMFDSQGNERTVMTNGFGYYRFENIRVGETVTIRAEAKRYRFNQSMIVRTINENLEGIDFIVIDSGF